MKQMRFKKWFAKSIERFNLISHLLLRIFILSFIGLIIGIGLVNFFPVLLSYEEYIYATLISAGSTVAVYTFGFRFFKWLVFLFFYVYYLVPYAIAIGTINDVPAGTITLKIVFGIIFMVILIIGVRLYIVKDLAMQIGPFQFGDIPCPDSLNKIDDSNSNE